MAAALLALGLASCATTPAQTASRPTTPNAAERPAGVVFLRDDFPGAMAKAKAEKKLVFVDAWAPWCHSCLSMKEYTLSSPELAPLGKDYVFLEVDTERGESRAFVERYPNRVWPTLYVIDPEADRAVLAWPGTATAPELAVLLADTRTAVRDANPDNPHALLLRASMLAHLEKWHDARDLYMGLLVHPSPTIRARTAEALTTLLSSRDRHAECVEVATVMFPTLPEGSSRAATIVNGLSCAAEDPSLDARRLTEAARALLDAAAGSLLADDRSGIYEALVELFDKRKDSTAKLDTARAWSRFLDAEAARARTPEERTVFDYHRVLAYEALGEPARAIPMLEQSQRDFPADYNPPARLARVHLALGHVADARRAIDLASARVYGPRTLRVAAASADVAEAEKSPARAREILEKAVRDTEAMPLSPGQKKLRADLVKRTEKLAVSPR